jgi:hypothetical protein
MGWSKKLDGQLVFSERDPSWIQGGVEVRCPGKFKKLFLMLKQEHMPEQGMFMEIACADCAKEARTEGLVNVKRALHYYDGSGNCVSTKIVTE